MSSALPQLRFLRHVLRFAWFVLGAAFLAWIFWRNFPLTGVLSAQARTAEPNGFIGGFTPQDRAKPVQENGVWYSDIVDEPVYFNLAAPRFYDTVRVQLRYKEEKQPYIALGARTDLDQWQFDLKPLDLPLLDDAGWSARQDGELRVYERKATTRSAQQILASGGRVAVLGLDPVRWNLRLPALSGEKPVDAVLNEPGARTLYVYVQKGPFELSLGLRGSDKEEAKIALERDGETLLARTHRGDGAVEMALTGAKPGLYRLRIDAPDDVSLVGIESRQSRIVLLDTEGQHVYVPEGATSFDPEFPTINALTDLKTAPYDAVVARYHPPTIDADGWRTAEAEFSLREMAASQGHTQMLLSLPAIKTVGGTVRVDSVRVDYLRPPIDFRNLLDQLKKKL